MNMLFLVGAAPPPPKKSSSPLKYLIIVSSLLFLAYVLVSLSMVDDHHHLWSKTVLDVDDVSSLTSLDHIVFGVASNTESWPKRKDYVHLWWQPEYRGCIFLEKVPLDTTPHNLNNNNNTNNNNSPPICISEDTSSFRYTHKGGLRSAIRVARVVSETIALNHSNVRWFVFGDDDTVFIPENLAKTLSKYDHEQWYYIGTNSETWEQNDWFSYEMAFGGGGFALSYPLAKVFAKISDSCLVRYPHLYGSDARISSCLAELGVVLTHELGFHQLDVRGDIFGLLAAHPLQPLVSLHHLDYIEPIFPNMTSIQALRHLLIAAKKDPARILQQSVCYETRKSWSVLISWGYAIQVYDHNVLLPELLPVQKTFKPWKERSSAYSNLFVFNTKPLPSDPCKRPLTFFLQNVSNSDAGVESIYKTSANPSCSHNNISKKLQDIKVFSQKLHLDITKLQAPRRQCCDVLPSSTGKRLDIAIRQCREEELVYMHA